ncbi:MAG: hypothetical protein ACRECZ_04720, partial [Methylocella sp.]
MMSLAALARALGGQVNGTQVLAPGPGHSATDRSLSVKLSRTAPDGFVVNSFAGDDPIVCRDHVLSKGGLPPFKAAGKGKVSRPEPVRAISYDYRDPASGEVRYLKKRVYRADGGKTFSFWQPNGLKGRGGVLPLLYGGERLAALSEGQAVWIVEGEKKVDRLKELGAIAVSGDCGASSKWLPSHAELLRGSRVILWPDSDEPGESYIANAAAAIRAVNPDADIRAVRPFGLPNGAKGKDVCDWTGDVAALAELAAGSVPYEAAAKAGAAYSHDGVASGVSGEELTDAEIARLAKLSLVAYDKERPGVAKRCGIRASILDKAVLAARPQEDKPPGLGRPLEFEEPEAWDSPVDGVALIAELEAAISRYVVMPEGAAFTVALWILHAFCFDAFPCTPRLAITSPVKRCGKTTLLDVIAALTPRPLPAANITSAATFRTIEAARPTLMIDEADTFLSENEELRGILNSGHRASGQVIRTVGDDFEPRAFATHCPVAIAMIGKLPDTLADRAIHVEMKRRAPGEKVSRLRIGRAPELAEAVRKAARWA